MARKASHYTKPTKYTQKELDRARLSDLEVDLRCAVRDGLTDYAAHVQTELQALTRTFEIQHGEPYVALSYVTPSL